MELYNHLRLHRYDRALETSEVVLDLPDLDEERSRDARNMNRLALALKEVPPQRVEKHADSVIELVRETHLVLTINGSRRDYAYDTGANFSCLIRSEANCPSAGWDASISPSARRR